MEGRSYDFFEIFPHVNPGCVSTYGIPLVLDT